MQEVRSAEVLLGLVFCVHRRAAMVRPGAVAIKQDGVHLPDGLPRTEIQAKSDRLKEGPK